MPDTHTVVIDRPFTTALDAASSVVQVGPMKGKIIFHRNSYTDGGSFQTYANAQDVIVSAHRFERSEALLSWGRSSGGGTYCPNINVQFLDNRVVEGNHWWNYNGSYPWIDGVGHPKTIEPYFIGIFASDQDPQPCMPCAQRGLAPPCDPCPPSRPQGFQGALNHLITLRGNVMENNGGISVRGHTASVLVEGNIIRKSHVGIDVNRTFASHVEVVKSEL